jgi:hypothetical protein
MPGDAETVLFIDLAELKKAPFFAELMAWAAKPQTDAEYVQLQRDTGFDYEKDLDQVAVAFLKRGPQQNFFAVAHGRFDRQKIEEYAAKSGTVQQQGRQEIFSVPLAGRPERLLFTFLRADFVAVTNADNLSSFLKPAESAEWHTRFARLAGSPVFAVMGNAALKDALASLSDSQSLARRSTGGLTSPQLSFMLQQLQWLSVAGKPEGERLRVVAEAESSDENNARRLADTLNGMVLLAHAGLGSARPRQEIDAGTRESYLALLKSVDISRIDRGETKSVRLMFEVTANLLKSARVSVPTTTPAPQARVPAKQITP